jgi:acyl-CoA reductase-like NAD-dependent aldehyde dehydrogenase
MAERQVDDGRDLPELLARREFRAVHSLLDQADTSASLMRVAAIRQGSPLDPGKMIGAQASREQLEKILGYSEIGARKGPRSWRAASAAFSKATCRAATM